MTGHTGPSNTLPVTPESKGTMLVSPVFSPAPNSIGTSNTSSFSGRPEGLSFLNPIKVGQLAHLEAKVVCTGKTSLVTKVVVSAEDMDTGETKKTSEAYLTFVNIDKTGKPSPVPPLLLETEQDKIDFRFVLALILMRKKILKYDETKIKNDNEIWRLRISGDKQIVDVVNPHLDEEQIERLSSQIGEILQADL